MRGDEASSCPPAHPPADLPVRGGAPSAGAVRVVLRRAGRRAGDRPHRAALGARASCPGLEDRARFSTKRALCGVAGGAGPGARAEPANRRPVRRYARRCNSLEQGWAASRIGNCIPGPEERRGLQRRRRGHPNRLVGGRHGSRLVPLPTWHASWPDRPSRRVRRTGKCRAAGHFPRDGTRDGASPRAAALVDTRREPNLSFGVAELSFISPGAAMGGRCQRNVPCVPASPGNPRPGIAVRPAPGGDRYFLRPEPLPGHPNEGPIPA